MNIVEKRFFDYEKHNNGGIIVEIPLLPPIPTTQIDVACTLVESGIDIIQVSVPVRFPWMYGERHLNLARNAAINDVDYKQSFEVLEKLTKQHEGAEFMPVGFYGGIQRMGQDKYISECKRLGIRLVDVPDYPLVHDQDPKGLVGELRSKGISYVTIFNTELALAPEGTRAYQNLCKLVAQSSGFCFLLAAAGGKTGEKKSFEYDGLLRAKERLLSIQKRMDRRCPIVVVCGISTPEQVRILVKEVGVHVMFGSALFKRMMNGDSQRDIAEFLTKMKRAAT